MKRKVGKEDQVVRQTRNSKYYESLETLPIKRTVGRSKKSVSANENKSSSVKRRGRPTKVNDEEKNQTVGSKGYYVIDNFDIETNVLSLTDSLILVTSESVNDILGIPMGGCSIESLEPRTADDPFIKEWLSQFREKTEIRPNDISEVIVSTKDAGKLFKMNFLMNCKIRTRTTPTTLFNAMAILNDDRKKCLNEMGFASMIGMGIYELPGKLGYYVIDNFDTETNVLSLNDSSILVTSKSLLYLHSTKCDELDVIRQTPAIRNWKSVQMKHQEKLEIENFRRLGMLPKHEDVNLQSQDFVEMILSKFENINYDLRSLNLARNDNAEDANVANPSEAANVAQASPTAQVSRAAILHASPIRMTKKAKKRTG
nr:hypothetical protein [Tanacetum cinerariifolium]